MLYLSKQLAKNITFTQMAIVSLFEVKTDWDEIKKLIVAGLKLIHFKGVDLQSLIYNPISLLNVNLALKPNYAKGKELGEIELEQLIRITYISNKEYHIETNSYLSEDAIIRLKSHPLNHLFPSNRFFVKSFSDKNLYTNSRYSYDLTFTYIESDFFKVTEKNWIFFKKLKNDPKKRESLTKEELNHLILDFKKRKEKIKPYKEKVRNWILENQSKSNHKNLKVMVLDIQYHIYKQLKTRIENLNFSLNIQPYLKNRELQLKRVMAPLILVEFDEDYNNYNELRKIVTAIKTIDDYEPYIVIFNSNRPSQEVAKEILWARTLTFNKSINLNILKQMISKLKKTISPLDKERVYLQSSNPLSNVSVLKKVKIISFTESVIYFESKEEIPMWTVFKVSQPVRMLLTVVPFKETSEYKSKSNIYRALVNGVGDSEKAILRTLVNKSLEKSSKLS